MAVDALSIINNALRQFGAGQIFALDEDTDLANNVVPLYDDLVDAALGLYAWSWSRRTRQLQQTTDDLAPGWSTGYAFPPEAVGPPLALFTDPRQPMLRLRDFTVEGRTVSCNITAGLYGAFPMRIDPALWPAPFRLAFTKWLQATIVVPVSHDINGAAALLAEAVGSPSEGMRGGLMGRAIAWDAATSGGPAGINLTDDFTSRHTAAGDGWSGGAGW